MKKSQSEKFQQWYNGYFLASRNPTSPLLVGENKQIQAKFQRIGIVCNIIINNQDMTWVQIRKKVAMEFFISMRCSLDYINYAKNVLEEFRKVYK